MRDIIKLSSYYLLAAIIVYGLSVPISILFLTLPEFITNLLTIDGTLLYIIIFTSVLVYVNIFDDSLIELINRLEEELERL